jgi:poly-beta-1,6-N-acetyl-D-glucosamine synthase
VLAAIGIMAYNEEANVASCVRSILAQRGAHVEIGTVTVVASGCTDRTAARAIEAAAGDARFRLIEQPVREGKATAITAFMRSVPEARLLVLAGGDTTLEPGALEALLAPFDDPGVGMTGGRPSPINSRDTLMGRVVHLLWSLHHAIASRTPKLGELVAFRPVFDSVPADSAVDEAQIEALVRARGLRLAYAPAAVVRMKGPGTVSDFVAQRRRIHAGHLRLRRSTGHTVSTMSLRSIGAALRDGGRGAGAGPLTLAAAVALEAAARFLGAWDARVAGRDHSVWKPIRSTKDLRR